MSSRATEKEPVSTRRAGRAPPPTPRRQTELLGSFLAGRPDVSLYFKNCYPSTIWSMILWYHANCEDGGNWEKMGWWRIEPGQQATVSVADLDEVNRYWYYYAQAANGAYWAGPYGVVVPHTAFDWCVDTANTDSFDVGMRELDIGGNDDYTLTFVP
jgi:uncharacterized membrane protein